MSGRSLLSVVAKGSTAFAFLVFFATSLPPALRSLKEAAAAGLRTARLGELDARRATFGAAYADALEGIRRRLPVEDPYLVATQANDIVSFAVYDLAPRPALAAVTGIPALKRVRPLAARRALPEWCVVVRRGQVPRLLPTASALALPDR